MRIKELRIEQKINQKDIAKILNVDVKTYRSWEQEKAAPSIAAVKQLADMYHVSSDYILGISDFKNIGNKECMSLSGLSEKSIEKLRNMSKLELLTIDAAIQNIDPLVECIQINAADETYKNSWIEKSYFVEKKLEEFFCKMKLDENLLNHVMEKKEKEILKKAIDTINQSPNLKDEQKKKVVRRIKQ